LEVGSYPLELDNLLARADALVRRCQSKKPKARNSSRPPVTVPTGSLTVAATPVNDNSSSSSSASSATAPISISSSSAVALSLLPTSPADDVNDGQRPSPYIARLLKIKGMPGTKDACTKSIRRSFAFASARERLLRLEKSLVAMKKHFERRFLETKGLTAGVNGGQEMIAFSINRAQKLDELKLDISASSVLQNAVHSTSIDGLNCVFGPFDDSSSLS
jgi:hypothetical protein